MEKMRLIDADALLENQPKGCYRTSDWINAAPTIEAIPVEWLKDKMHNSPKELSLAAWRVLNAWRPRNEQEGKNEHERMGEA
jgi:hypothetical protein